MLGPNLPPGGRNWLLIYPNCFVSDLRKYTVLHGVLKAKAFPWQCHLQSLNMEEKEQVGEYSLCTFSDFRHVTSNDFSLHNILLGPILYKKL